MRLVIREYLSMLKESGELDALLPDLLFSMDIEPISRPQVGVRQYGVDVAGVGPDPDDSGTRKLFLLVIKQGDLDRTSWDSGPQAVRQSLNDILDVYLAQYVGREHEDLPKKIVVCSNGIIKPNVDPNWQGYKDQHSESGVREYDFWGGDKLALLVERHFLDEYLFPETAQKQMRKTIALVDQNEEDPHYFYSLVHETLFERDLSTDDTPSARRKRQHALRLLNLSLNIVFHWCREANNLRPALLCAERAVLLVWDWMRQGDLLDCRSTREGFEQLLGTYLKIATSYVTKLTPLCLVRDGFFGQGADELEYPLRTFEVIGVFGVLVMVLKDVAAEENDSVRTTLNEAMQQVTQTLVALIANNPSASAPPFDGHSVEIALGLLALTQVGFRLEAAVWINNLGQHIVWAYQLGWHFPIYTDSYDDLIAMRYGQAPPKEKLMEISTLLPMLAHWYAVMDMPGAAYEGLQKAIGATFPGTDLQLWFPDDSTEDQLYRENAGFTSGNTLSSIQLPTTLDELKVHILRLHEGHRAFEMLSCFTTGWPSLGLIASRHYRTPVIPAYWLEAVDED